ncbi:hypothetical protein INR49_006369 [Caranx melampygus]|nr:hypothetical protein INR49_006369 [Caranx melampygus]
MMRKKAALHLSGIIIIIIIIVIRSSPWGRVAQSDVFGILPKNISPLRDCMIPLYFLLYGRHHPTVSLRLELQDPDLLYNSTLYHAEVKAEPLDWKRKKKKRKKRLGKQQNNWRDISVAQFTNKKQLKTLPVKYLRVGNRSSSYRRGSSVLLRLSAAQPQTTASANRNPSSAPPDPLPPRLLKLLKFSVSSSS